MLVHLAGVAGPGTCFFTVVSFSVIYCAGDAVGLDWSGMWAGGNGAAVDQLQSEWSWEAHTGVVGILKPVS
jgi:hypothetical protein